MNFINKTENKLKRNYPNLWNLHLFRFGIYACILYLIMIITTYLFVSITPYNELIKLDGWEIYELKFKRTGIGKFMITTSYIFAIILAVAWYIFYQKQNPLKTFYPQKAWKYYLNFLGVTFLLSIFSLMFTGSEVGRYLKLSNSTTFLNDKQNQELLIKYNVLSNFSNGYHPYLYRYLGEHIGSTTNNDEEVINKQRMLSYKYYNTERINPLDEKLLSLNLINANEIIEIKKEVINHILERDEHYIYQLCESFNDLYKSLSKNNEPLLNANEASKEIANNPDLLFLYFHEATLDNSIFMQHDKLNEYISYITENRNFIIDSEQVLLSLLYSLIISLLIVVYRLTNIKTLLFATLYFILFLITSTILTSIVSGVNRNESFLSTLFFGFIFIPAILVIKSFINKNKSTLSEVAFIVLNAGLLSFPIFYLVLEKWSSSKSSVDIITIQYVYIILALFPLSIIIIKWKALAYK